MDPLDRLLSRDDVHTVTFVYGGTQMVVEQADGTETPFVGDCASSCVRHAAEWLDSL